MGDWPSLELCRAVVLANLKKWHKVYSEDDRQHCIKYKNKNKQTKKYCSNICMNSHGIIWIIHSNPCCRWKMMHCTHRRLRNGPLLTKVCDFWDYGSEFLLHHTLPHWHSPQHMHPAKHTSCHRHAESRSTEVVKKMGGQTATRADEQPQTACRLTKRENQ